MEAASMQAKLFEQQKELQMLQERKERVREDARQAREEREEFSQQHQQRQQHQQHQQHALPSPSSSARGPHVPPPLSLVDESLSAGHTPSEFDDLVMEAAIKEQMQAMRFQSPQQLSQPDADFVSPTKAPPPGANPEFDARAQRILHQVRDSIVEKQRFLDEDTMQPPRQQQPQRQQEQQRQRKQWGAPSVPQLPFVGGDTLQPQRQQGQGGPPLSARGFKNRSPRQDRRQPNTAR
jgi:hypothetical protein